MSNLWTLIWVIVAIIIIVILLKFLFGILAVLPFTFDHEVQFLTQYAQPTIRI